MGMFAQQLSRAFAARGIHYAWFVALLTFFFSLAASTALTVPGVLIIPMSEEFGWSLGDSSHQANAPIMPIRQSPLLWPFGFSCLAQSLPSLGL
jgi:hypothetical protein